jgi:hypothetical protein
VADADRRSPGPAALTLLAAPGIVCWALWGFALLAPSGVPGRGVAAAAAFPLGFLALGAGIAAFGCRAPRSLRWLVGAQGIAAFPCGFLLHMATARAFL